MKFVKKLGFNTLAILLAYLFIPGSAMAYDLKTSYLQLSETSRYTDEDLEQVLLSHPTAEEINPKEEGLQAYLRRGDIAPFEGVLLDPLATAIILTEFIREREQAALALGKQRKSDLAKLRFETDKLLVENESLKTKSDINLKSKDKEISRLKDINRDILDDKNNFWEDLMLVGAGVGVGILTGVLIVVLSGAN